MCVDSAFIDSGYGEIDGDYGGKIYQDLSDTLFEEGKYRLSVYAVTDSFTSDSGKVQILYRYKNGDSTVTALEIAVQNGDNASTGYNSLTDTFTYAPSSDTADSFIGCRVQVEQGNSGQFPS